MIMAAAAEKTSDVAPSMMKNLLGLEYPKAIGFTAAPTTELDQTLKPVW